MDTAIATLQRDVSEIRAELRHIRLMLEDEPLLADDVVREIEQSREHPDELVPHEEIVREFGGG